MAGKLTALGVKALAAGSRTARFNDGDGLYLRVRAPGRADWVLRYRVATKLRDMGLGPYPEVPLARARELAADARRQRRGGYDPIDARKAAKQAKAAVHEPTFREVAKIYIANHSPSWRNSKHAAQWKSTLEAYAYPFFGDRRVSKVDREIVLEALRAIWTAKPETANRLRGRIEAILNLASARGWWSGANPADWKHLQQDLPSPRRVKERQHQTSLPYSRITAFLQELRKRRGLAAQALQLTILTAARTQEITGARWGEIDFDEAVWTLPAARMKAGKSHQVPLSAAAIAVLRPLKPAAATPEDFVFPGAKAGKSLSNMAMLELVRGMNEEGKSATKNTRPRWCDAEGLAITVHGFRATFRVWVGEQTQFPRELAEAALAHTIRDKVEAAYARTGLLERRRPLMTAWAEWCSRPQLVQRGGTKQTPAPTPEARAVSGGLSHHP
ncbi:tyrosine-type recombinase/integrase [Roseomonas elaeocarpi]|uniref:Tyrosine-type recombinase/integrase n=1 Tax=Roseomonas elaeocarpi TaxID=907779 RepID=A0ABV6JVN5_9PROT